MDYIQMLLQMQTALAQALEEEPGMELPEAAMIRPRQGSQEEEQEAFAAESREESMEAEEPAAKKSQSATGGEERQEARWMLERLELLQAANGRAAMIAQTLAEQKISALQKSQSGYVSQQGDSRFLGGVTAEPARPLLASGIAGQQTQRTMFDISRYFERDARRYGG